MRSTNNRAHRDIASALGISPDKATAAGDSAAPSGDSSTSPAAGSTPSASSPAATKPATTPSTNSPPASVSKTTVSTPAKTTNSPPAGQSSSNSPGSSSSSSKSSSTTQTTTTTTTTTTTSSNSLSLGATPSDTLLTGPPTTLPGAGTLPPTVDSGISTPPVLSPSFSIPSSTPTSGAANGGAGSGGSSTTKVIGIAAASILGIAVIVALTTFLVKRVTRKRRDEALGDVFDRADFTRQSQLIPDDAPSVSRTPSGGMGMQEARRGPRPPTMLARHMQNYGPDAGYQQPQAHSYPPTDYNNGYQPDYPPANDFGYDQQPQQQQYGGQYGHGHGNGFAQYEASPAQSPLGDAFPPAPADVQSDPAYLNHQVGRKLTQRGPQVNLDHLARGQSVTPFQAAQYAEISRRLADDPADQGNGQRGDAYARLAREPSHRAVVVGPGGGRAAIQAGAYAPEMDDPFGTGAGRPRSTYDESDAYGGI